MDSHTLTQDKEVVSEQLNLNQQLLIHVYWSKNMRREKTYRKSSPFVNMILLGLGSHFPRPTSFNCFVLKTFELLYMMF